MGETGTGKEMVARAIHRLDPNRRNGPFVPVNCGAINASLAESELFGHRRGAFTGAERDRKGLVRAAIGGVLFLDEIGDLDANLQSKLLRVLQEHRVLALGDDQEVPVDVRVIAATNRHLDDMARKGVFRADLFHRLHVLSVRIPPLRERPDDIAPLVRHFCARCDAAACEGADLVTEEFLEALRRVVLPGNVRQLENLVRRAFLTRQGDGPLRLSDLPPEIWIQIADTTGSDIEQAAYDEQVPTPRSPVASQPSGVDDGVFDPVDVLDANSWKLWRSLDFCEHKIVVAALGASHGNRSRAARLLGISLRSIFNKMRKYRLDT
jgi:transcriptional regulator with PAS, ATPase and Fis domain